MSKRILLLTSAALLLAVTPAAAADDHADKSKTTGKHNFDQWQTIKRLQVPSVR